MYVLTHSLCNLKDDGSECGWMFILLYRCLDVRVFVFLSKKNKSLEKVYRKQHFQGIRNDIKKILFKTF